MNGTDRHCRQEKPGPTISTIRPGALHVMEFQPVPGRIVEIVGCIFKKPSMHRAGPNR
jgi:hypothetical protein